MNKPVGIEISSDQAREIKNLSGSLEVTSTNATCHRFEFGMSYVLEKNLSGYSWSRSFGPSPLWRII
jgi:hypothetical protein